MQITEITIYPTNKDLVRARANIVFDNCLMIREIRVIKGRTGLFVAFPSKKQSDGTRRELAYPADPETRMIIQQAILAAYEKIVGNGDPMPSAH